MYLINEEQRKNLLVILDRTPIKGLKEIEAVIDIMGALNKKDEEESE